MMLTRNFSNPHVHCRKPSRNLVPMNTSTANTSTEARALELLACGVEQEHVASALGVTPGRISQLLSQPEFATALAEKKYQQLQKHNDTDNALDSLEKKIINKLDKTVDMVFDPMKLGNLLTRVNAAKRRGASAPDSLVRSKPTIRLNVTSAVVARFALNGANQVVSAQIGQQSQDLVTIQSSGVQRLLNEHSKTLALPAPPTDDKNSREYKAWRQEQRALVKESDGAVRTKAQGREKHDLLTECGFTEEVEITIPTE